ncbi:MAG: hypothetical protein CVV32_03320 [Methanomicrobiales archaeon HGW-Methanomicrobiales-3]|jgi:hypothetical protein|nr:MAG: hypothetical protein CVV32_03320 [Methanomicrobiales archaeon HGW-Methanomicrobiales-3]
MFKYLEILPDNGDFFRMDHSAAVSASIDYTKEAFIGKWTRWIIFVILGLPMALLPFVFDANTIPVSENFSWDQVPWGQVAALVIAGILLSFILSGYIVRIYRGIQPAPDFEDWGTLFIDGLKLNILSLIWILPILIFVLGVVGLAVFLMGTPESGSMALVAVLLAVIAIAMVFFIVIALFIPMALIRFARTGSIREGLRFSEISSHIARIGWGQYIIALIVLLVVMLIYGIVVTILSLIPFIGWVLELVATPLITVFAARFYTLVYEQGTEQPVVA